LSATNNLTLTKTNIAMTTQTTPTFKILKNIDGQRFLKIVKTGQIIPADIAGLGAGKDYWMSQVQCKCRDCKQSFPLRELNGGGQWCEECQAAGIED
jgi:hypothetical protein